MDLLNNTFKNKTVLVTGHTGFKGTWLITWLLNLGANVIGVSKGVPTQPAMFGILRLSERIQHYVMDIRNFKLLAQVISNEKPDFVFHLAAQAIVSTSYSDPLETVSSNVMGTTNLLEALRISNHQCTAIIITSDKAYDNVEQIWGYKEDDQMGGKDVYSGSKGAAELVIKSYVDSFFQNNHPVKIAIGRAGNVIGGGDCGISFSLTKLIFDILQALYLKRAIKIIYNSRDT